MSHDKGASLQTKRLIILFAFLLCLLPPLASAAKKFRKIPRPVRRTPASTPTPQPTPPIVDFQAVPERDSIERGEKLIISLFVANKSALLLTELKLDFPDQDFELVTGPSFPAELAPFRSNTQTAIIKAKDTADYITHKLLVSVEYAWSSDGTQYHSAQPAVVTVLVKRRFDEETKGFPGGTAAFFYLLLPIIPAILSYQFCDRIRKGEGPQVPSFNPEYIVPSFFVAVVLSLLMLSRFNRGTGLNYSDPQTFMSVLFGSLLAGAIVPTVRGIYELRQKRVWGFNNRETLTTYLRKALLAPSTPREFRWTTARIGAQTWEGILLQQPNGAAVLGAQLQVSYAAPVAQNVWNQFLQEVIAPDGTVINRPRLVEMVEAGTLKLEFFKRIQRNSQNVGEVVVIDEIKKWKRTDDGIVSPLIKPSS